MLNVVNQKGNVKVETLNYFYEHEIDLQTGKSTGKYVIVGVTHECSKCNFMNKIYTNHIVLGVYDSKKRAKEVFDDMTDHETRLVNMYVMPEK